MKNLFNNKNILIVKKKKFSSYYDFIIEALLKNNSPKKIKYIKFSGIKNIYKINNLIKETLYSESIDILITASYFFYDPKVLHQIQGKIFRIRIDGDDDWLYDHYTRWYAQLFDLNITTSNVIKLKLRQLGYNCISIPYFFNKYKKSTKLITDLMNHDVVFVGLVKGKEGRENYINFLTTNKINVKIFGEQNKKLDKFEMDYLYSHSKIIINFSRVNNDMKYITNYERDLERKTQIKARVFEVLRCGGFLLSEYTPDLDYYFKINKDLVTFNSKENLLEKIKFYLKHNDMRIEIAKSGQKKFNKYYEYSIYIDVLSTKIEKYFNKRIKIKKYFWPTEIKRFISRFIDYDDLFFFIIYDRAYLNFIRIDIIIRRYFSSLLKFMKIKKI